MNTAAVNFHNLGMNSLMMGGQPAHGWSNTVAGVGLPTMSNPNAPGFMAGGVPGLVAGGAIEAPFGGFLGGTPSAGEPAVRGNRMAGRARGREAGMGVPFGGYRRRGGPVSPGVAYIGGEDGPELFVPRVPGYIVPNDSLSMRAPKAASRAGGALSDRGPAGVQSGPLSLRGPVPMGGGMTPQRRMKIAERRLASQGDVVGAARMATSRLWAENLSGGGAPPRLMPGGPQPAAPVLMQPMPPPMPTGTDEDGFQLPLTPQGASARAPLPMPLPEPELQPPPMGSGGNPLGLIPAGAPNVPAGFGAMTQRQAFDPNSFPGVPLPPPGLYQEAPGYKVTEAGGMNILEGPDGKFRGFTKADAPPMPGWMNQPGTNLLMPTVGGQPNPALPIFQATPRDPLPPGAAGPQRPGAIITPVKKSSDQEMPKFERDTDSGKMFYIQPNERGGFTRKWVDEDGDGVVSPSEAAAAQAAGQTKSGVKFSRVQ